ncbi:MAG: HU family DNA-binding protein [Prevotellaceae bacterium]|jgi:predicted histone-like DNA-binding protein|nr:HU family DNA-binding protein [Prevotellaceae bacterium]
MGLNYDFYETPQNKGKEQKKIFHARVVPQGSMTTDALAKAIEKASSLTVGDVKSVLTALTQLMQSQLAEGWRIHLDGLGYFQLTLSCLPVTSSKEIRAESVHVKSVVFRPEANFKDSFKSAHLVRAPVKKHSRQYTEQEIEDILTAYFEENPYLTGPQFKTLCGFTHSTAARRLKQLIETGKLKKIRLCGQPLYEQVKEV